MTIGGTYRYALRLLPAILWITILTTLATLLGFILLIIPGDHRLVRLAFAPAVVGGRGASRVGGAAALVAADEGILLEDARNPAALGHDRRHRVGDPQHPRRAGGAGLGPDAWPISALVSVLATVLVTPFGMLVVVLLYFDLRIRKEGYDIEVMAQELASAP